MEAVGERPASFRKPAHDPSHRNYRRRSPTLSNSPSPPPSGSGKRTRSISRSPIRDGGALGPLDQVKKVRNTESERGGLNERSHRSRRDEHTPVSDQQIQTHNRKHKVDSFDSGSGQVTNYHSHSHAGTRQDHYRREPVSERLDWNDRPTMDRGYRDRDVETSRDKGKGMNRDDARAWGRDRGGERERERSRGEIGKTGLNTERDYNFSRAREVERERDRDRRRDRDRGRVNAGSQPRDEEEKESNRRRYRGNFKEVDRHKLREDVKERDRVREDMRGVDFQKDIDKVRDQSFQRDRDKEHAHRREGKEGRCSFQEVGKLNPCHDFEGGESKSNGEAVLHSDEGGRAKGDQDGGGKESGRDKRRHRGVMGREERERGATGWDQIAVLDGSARLGTLGKEKPSVSSVIVSEGTARGGSVHGGHEDLANHSNASGDLKLQVKSKLEDEETSANSCYAGSSQQPELHKSELDPGEMLADKGAHTSEEKPAKSSKWGPAPSTNDVMSAEVANDLNAAKMAAIRAAELVNRNMGIAGFMSADHKKKLLWGSKKAEVEQEPVVAAAGINRWDTVHFDDLDRREKFHKLMGVKGDLKDSDPPPPKGVAIFTEEKQKELQEDLEKQFTQGLRRRGDGRTVGLGL